MPVPRAAKSGRGEAVRLCWLVGAVLLATVAPTSAQTRITPVGDSITAGQGSANGLGYRDDLYDLLQAQGWDFEFVGSDGEPPYQGHFAGGRIADFYPSGFGNGWGNGSADITPTMVAYQPTALLIHLGTNDLTGDPPPYGPYSTDGGQSFLPNACGRLAEFLTYLLRWAGGPGGNHLETVVLCQIIPIREREPDVCSFNAHIAQMSLDFNLGLATGSPAHVVLCNQHAAFAANPWLFSGLPGDYMSDDLHPNDDGYCTMAQTFFASLLDNTPPAAIGDLAVTPLGCYRVMLTWTAVGDDMLWGQADHYEARSAPFAFSPLSFVDGFVLPGSPQPGMPGSPQQLLVPGAPDGCSTWFAIRTWDDAGNTSGLSNVVSATTLSATGRYESFGPGWESGWLAEPEYTVDDGSFTVSSGDSTWAPVAVYLKARSVDQAGLVWQGGGDRAAVVFLEDPEPPHAGWAVAWEEDSIALRRVTQGILGEYYAIKAIPTPPLSPGDSLETIMVRSLEGTSWWCYHNGLCQAAFELASRETLDVGGIALAPSEPALVEQFYVKGEELDPAPLEFQLLLPASDDTVISRCPTFVWQHADDPFQPVTYDLHIDTTATFHSPAIIVQEGLADTVLSLPYPLPPLPCFWWKVVATDCSGLQTACRSPYRFWLHPSLGATEHPPETAASVRILWCGRDRDPTLCLEGITGVARLELFDLVGRRVWRKDVRATSERAMLVSVSTCPRPGIYLLRLEAGTLVLKKRILLAR